MRQRLALIVLAVTAMVTVSFLVPLGMVVRVVARDRALSEGEQVARSLAGVVAALDDVRAAAGVVDQVNSDSRDGLRAAIVLPDGTALGPPVDVPDRELQLGRDGRAFTGGSGDAGSRVIVPVRTPSGTSVVVVLVPAGQLTQGVLPSWFALGTVGVALIVLAVALADRLARSTVRSMADLAGVTERLREGELDARVVPSGPPEVEVAGRTLNQLADRIDELLARERETLADVSHRLRTPLTALQLEVDGVGSPAVRRRLQPAVDRVKSAVTDFITEARRPRERSALAGAADLTQVVEERMAFWKVLAEDQARRCRWTTPGRPVLVKVSATELAATVDALVTNVFHHTPGGTAFEVAVTADADRAELSIDDDGPGIAHRPRRGASGAGSTGLGLDIARQAAERTGGELTIETSPSGGARVVLRFA